MNESLKREGAGAQARGVEAAPPPHRVGELGERARTRPTAWFGAAAARARSLADTAARRLVLSRLRGLEEGALTLAEGSGQSRFGEAAADALSARITVHRPRLWRRLLTSGTLGAAEAYIDGDWDADDLVSALRLFARSEAVVGGLDGLAPLRMALERGRRALAPNDRAGARRHVAAHYDLGNEFFELMLDPTLTYSCGLFERDDSTLEEASLAKIDRLCAMLRLREGEHLVEIGSGWGALAIRAASRFGCRVTTTTLSRAQHELATLRVKEAGLERRVEVLLADYRDLRGRYDKLVSVEMIEAIGWQQYETFFATCSRLLVPGGLATIQAITIADRHYERARRETEFVKRFIFPGGCIPSVTALLGAATEASDLTLRGLSDIGPHYARTLAAWRANLAGRAAEVERLTTARFRRQWHLYLCWCEAGFLERYISDVQLLFARPGAREG